MSANDRQIDGTHYKDMPIEPWMLMEAILTREEWIGYLKGNILKYSMRAGRKAGAHHDPEKAFHYMEKLKEVLTT